MTIAAQIRIGTSGWRYPPWRGRFYPADLAQARELAFASRQFPAIELNGSFYARQRPSTYLRWASATPDGFVFAVKATRHVTHILKLREAREAMANFFASGLLALGPKLGPILWQLPPSLEWDGPLLEAFLSGLPHDSAAALQLARDSEGRPHGDEWQGPAEPVRLRHALEVRNASFCQPEAVALLRRHRVALVVADAGGRWPEVCDVTADFVYLRLHGAPRLYASGYSDAQLATWARRIRTWAAGGTPDDMARISHEPPPAAGTRPVFCFFDNTMTALATENALQLASALALDDQLHIPS